MKGGRNELKGACIVHGTLSESAEKREVVPPNVKTERLSRKPRDNNVTDYKIKWKQRKRDVKDKLARIHFQE